MFLPGFIPNRCKKLTELTPNQIKQAIKAEVKNLGFHLSGFTTPEPIGDFNGYKQWIQAGYNAEMHYLSRASSLEKRKNPRLVFPPVESILVLGIPYPAPKKSEDFSIAAYAQGPDYHDLIPDRLSGFQPWLEGLVGQTVDLRIFTDTAPIMEKQLAVRAGLGWIGKNGLLINPEYGSFFFLTEIFLGIQLPPDEPFSKGLCGNCTQCIDNCPTNSILCNRKIDANKCLSYLTIEKKGAFSIEESQFITASAFGCDLCQEVCPWNHKRLSNDTVPTLFSSDTTLSSISQEDLLTLDEETFRQRYKKTPISRTKRKGMIRNLLTIIANNGTADDLKLLSTFLQYEQNENLRMMANHAQAKISERCNINTD